MSFVVHWFREKRLIVEASTRWRQYNLSREIEKRDELMPLPNVNLVVACIHSVIRFVLLMLYYNDDVSELPFDVNKLRNLA